MDIIDHYTANDLAIMKISYESLNRSNNRIEEIIAFAKQANYKKIGIAYCVSVLKEAAVFENRLIAEGFQVEKVPCKVGKLPASKFIENYKGVSCNPVGQALFLEEMKTEINVVMGLCIGHDIIFNSKSAAPVTTLIVKDRKLKHKSIESLTEEAIH